MESFVNFWVKKFPKPDFLWIFEVVHLLRYVCIVQDEHTVNRNWETAENGHWKNQCRLFFLTWHCQFFYITKYCIENCIIKFCWISFESSFKPDTNNRIERLQRIWNSELFQSCIIRVWTYEHYDCDIALSLKFFLLNIIWDMGY